MQQFKHLIVNDRTIDFQKIALRLGFNEPSKAIEKIAEFCQRWKIQEFYLFGSVLRDDFRPESDIDVMVKFTPDARWGLKFVTMNLELEEIFQRKVDFISKKGIERSDNWIIREEILNTAKLMYVQE